MTTRSTRPWIKVDVGLLLDERFLALTDRLRGVWIAAYLSVAADGDECKSRARLAFLLGRADVNDPEQAVKDLDAAGWIEDLGDGRVTIRGFRKHQLVYRGPSDLPGAKAERNAQRGTTRSERERSGAREERRGEDRTPSRIRAGSGANGATMKPTRFGDLVGDIPSLGILGQREPVVE